MTDTTSAAATKLPPITDADRQFLHDNPNTDDVVKWVQNYARLAIAPKFGAQQTPQSEDLSGCGAQLLEENGRKVLSYWPYCNKCRKPFEFEKDEPFASCGCPGSTEWGDPRPASWVQSPAPNARLEAVAALREALEKPAPAAQGDALPREDFAWMVVQEACETEPADEDDPECIRILRIDLKSAVLAAFLRLDAARAQAKEGGE